jgi:MYXO-CTERM domain-containing protein
MLPLPLEVPGEQARAAPRLQIGAARRTLRIRRRLSAEGSRPWLLEIEIDVTIPDPEAVLAGSEGFLVDGADGQELGVVEEVETGTDGAVTALVVAGGWFGRRRARIPVEAIDVITPADRRIVVRP